MSVPHFEYPADNDAPVLVKHEHAVDIMGRARDAAANGNWEEHPGEKRLERDSRAM